MNFYLSIHVRQTQIIPYLKLEENQSQKQTSTSSPSQPATHALTHRHTPNQKPIQTPKAIEPLPRKRFLTFARPHLRPSPPHRNKLASPRRPILSEARI